MVNDKYHKIALIDADYYIINYSSTITTYIQHICNNLLNNNRNEVNLKDKSNEKRKINDKSDDFLYRQKQIICMFMLKIFLNNLDKNLNLFDYLIIVINKYFQLVQKYKLTNTYENIKIEDNIEICKNKKDTNVDVSKLGEGQECHKEISLSDDLNKKIEINNNINNKSITTKITTTTKTTNSNNNNNDNQVMLDSINISNLNNLSKDKIITTQNHHYNHLIHNLIENNNYINIDNIINSQLCFINIKDNEYDKCSKNKSSTCVEINNIYEEQKCNNTNYNETHKFNDECQDNSLIMSDEYNFIDSTNKDIKKLFPDMINNKKLLINYNKINIKLKRFDDTINIYDLINGYKVYENVGSLYEIKNLFRILILSKLHIGVYNLLDFLKKKNIFMLFYSSNKNLTNLLFKYNKIYKYYQNYYNVIDSLDELKKYEEDCHKFLIFSNRPCFICHAKRHGIFYTAIGNSKNDDSDKNEKNKNSNNIENNKNYYNRKSSNCDDIDWTNEIYEQKKSDESIIENFSNEYNNVVYPYIKNCNLTLDILSWRMIYIFKKYLYIYGKVVKGFGRGSKYLNLPTANIFHPNFISADIMPGIYFGICKLRDKIFKSVISIGYNPYFKNKHMTIEAFLYYKTDDLFYDENIHLIIIGIIRSESNFAYFSHLIQAIQFDCELARIVLGKLKNNETFQQCKFFLNNIK
ncbi:riboflavin kinase / FAD synthase family protein, putative [Plasmodium sp. gorilla clade G2]|uniref:riboflavin kinase / FAD synthase family protein, putative n=1 Tax=Plasmodium sp. gorilla clade G2 TaxID=880535 RepID=UPI000D1FED6A|nr:riboflavin kinase / FAD synthase family protein, putative [Plasmodium sp. gorilla clade G2]SOV18411.1 riboflavin kinase / FAD synthase family protein, putative [Plasmodium sp. gorilla clade G2]